MLAWNDTVRGFQTRLLELKSPKTVESYLYAVRLWEIFLVEREVDLASAHPGLLDDFVRWMAKRGLGPQTIVSRCTGVNSWLKHLKRIGYKVPELMAPDLPKVLSKDPVVLSLDELRTFFEIVNELEEPQRTALTVMPLSGLRSEEVAKISLSQLRVKDGWIIFTFIGKGGKERSVPMLKQGNSIVRGYLTGWRANHRTKYVNDWLFPGHVSGKHVSTRTIRNWVSYVSKRMGVEELSPHVLRKTYTTMLDSMGVSPLMIAQLVGHSNLKTTSKHYVKHDVSSLMTSLAKVHVPGALAT